jgi:hypothetical protein
MIQFRLINVSINASSCMHNYAFDMCGVDAPVRHLTHNGIVAKLRNNINQPVSPNKRQYSSLSLSEPW